MWSVGARRLVRHRRRDRSFSLLRCDGQIFKRSYGTTWTLQFRKRKLIRARSCTRRQGKPSVARFPLALCRGICSPLLLLFAGVRGSGVGEEPLGKHTESSEPFPLFACSFCTKEIIATQTANAFYCSEQFFFKERKTPTTADMRAPLLTFHPS